MFILGILNIVCGGLVILTHIFKQFDYVTHATENVLIILAGVVFLCTGFILIGISRILKKIEESNPNISDTTIRNCFNEVNRLLKEIKDSILNLETNEEKYTASSSNKPIGDVEKQNIDSDVSFDNCEIVHRNGRIFALLNGNLYCKKCHAFIDSDIKSMCPNCGSSLME